MYKLSNEVYILALSHVMGNMSNGSRNYTYNASNSGSNFNYSKETSKYINTYVYGNSNYDQTVMNLTRLGDATGENMLTSTYNGSWYKAWSIFCKSSKPRFARYDAFFFFSYSGRASKDYSTCCSSNIIRV